MWNKLVCQNDETDLNYLTMEGKIQTFRTSSMAFGFIMYWASYILLHYGYTVMVIEIFWFLLVICCMGMNAALTTLKQLLGCRVPQFHLACHLVHTFIWGTSEFREGLFFFLMNMCKSGNYTLNPGVFNVLLCLVLLLILCKPQHNPNIGWRDYYVHMPLLKCAAYLCQHAWVCVRARPQTTSKQNQHQGKAILPVSFCNVPWSQTPLMAKVATLIFSCCLKVRFYRYFVCPGQ